MLKTQVDDELWMVHQPDHARVSGYLAAHWGNASGFARPGQFGGASDSGRVRQEVVHAIAEHDNGWWEWEAAPSIDSADGLPHDLPDASKDRVDAGLQRWRIGVPRLSAAHPYVALLISMHAYWLYAFAFDDLPGRDDALRHPIFGRSDTVNTLVADRDITRAFLSEQQQTQRELQTRLQASPAWAAAVEPRELLPHARLLQVLDSLSLLLSFGGREEVTVHDIPRAGWEDRVDMAWRPGADRRIVCDPYPFDEDPLEVLLPARVVPAPAASSAAGGGGLPLLRLHAAPLRAIGFELVSKL